MGTGYIEAIKGETNGAAGAYGCCGERLFFQDERKKTRNH
jgi:hypothetical protein